MLPTVIAVSTEYKTEARFDYVEIKDSKGNIVDKISGRGDNLVTEYVEGDTLTLTFKSDRSVNDWGVLIDTYQVIMK